MTTILKTRSLGDIRGIKYANLKDRFADAELIEERKGDILDALTDGPTALSLPVGCEIELGHVQHSLPGKELTQSDIDCLNLNIACPSDASSSSKLPVLVYIHGGGLFIGANSWPQNDLYRLVKLSTEKRLPVVVVAINYRLGAPGFLTSEELRNAGYHANNGLRDQRVALEWVRRHIADFSGDPDNITVAGMSAGGASVTYHLQSKVPLFKRAISMSGTSLFVQALPFNVHEENYANAIAALGLTDLTAEDRLKALLNMPSHELLAKLPPSILVAPAIDSEIVLPGVTYTELGKKDSNVLPGNSWCQDLLIGDAEADASILQVVAPHINTNTERILNAYGITMDTPDEKSIFLILNFISDIMCHAAALSFVRGWSGNAYVYHFNEGNPWDGPWKGRANHILDTAYLFQNFIEYLSPEQRAVGLALAEDFFKFCHGIKPWPTITPGNIRDGFSARVYGPSDKGMISRVATEAFGGVSMRRGILFDSADSVSLDEYARVFAIFMTS
ncbi:alpha/beta-hydrolase [Penicillium maclennaniae]|uniref:alpha/beta-hydrolase n=1 Tax=Penicillium maclennaniae TaxID=1343394 RepID=UPI00254041AA|nr:alpha/beta-hydrolase [Penicillium maclennaniae]KAJ5674410.1 alpha/beta-hydrolase [Penicillium maclennaniae]